MHKNKHTNQTNRNIINRQKQSLIYKVPYWSRYSVTRMQRHDEHHLGIPYGAGKWTRPGIIFLYRWKEGMRVAT
jgi:hypothetical protein